MKKLSIFTALLLCAGFAFAADLQGALKETAEQFSASLKPKSVVAIIGIHSESPALSEFMLDELTLQLVKMKKLTIADRANLEVIKKEMSFQLSGEVGDESIQQLGAKIGAETVIQGVFKPLGKSAYYTLTIRALNVTTAAVTDMYRTTVELNNVEAEMLGEAATVKKTKANYSVASVGFQNLLFGLGSYRTKHPGDGAILTTGHLLGWIFIFVGAGMLAGGEDSGRLQSQPSFTTEHEYREYQRQQSEHRRVAAERTDLGLGLMIPGILIELGSIIYGFVMPAVHLKRARVLAYGNNSGLKFDLTYTSAGNIAPRISYVLRY